MDRTSDLDVHAQAPWSRVALAAIALLAYASLFWPTSLIRSWVEAHAGALLQTEVWPLVAHALLYSTCGATVSAGAWVGLARSGWMVRPGAMLGWPDGRGGIAALGVGLALAGVTLGLYLLLGWLEIPGGGPLRPHAISLWSVLGNLFSNFYEELIYRGFLISVLSALGARGAWAVAISALVFGFSHYQYPIALQLLVCMSGLGLGALALRTRSVWAAWIAHCVVDYVLDPLL